MSKEREIENLFKDPSSDAAATAYKIEIICSGIKDVRNILDKKDAHSDKLRELFIQEISAEKYERRLENIITKVSEIRNSIIYGKALWTSIDELNTEYSSKICQEMLDAAVAEVERFINTLKEACDKKVSYKVLIDIDLPVYFTILRMFRIANNAKSVARVNNIHVISRRHLMGEIKEDKYLSEIKEQIEYFETFLGICKTFKRELLYAYLLRFDFRSHKLNKTAFLSRMKIMLFKKIKEDQFI